VVCQVWQDCEGLSLWVSDLTSTIDAAPEKKRGPAILQKNGKDQAAATLCKAPFVVSASDSGLKASRQRGRGCSDPAILSRPERQACEPRKGLTTLQSRGTLQRCRTQWGLPTVSGDAVGLSEGSSVPAARSSTSCEKNYDGLALIGKR
jgi:hypothetical protein